MSMLLTILPWITIGLCASYILCSILFAPCELVIIGVATDPLLITKILPVVAVSFAYKDMVILAIAVYAFLTKFMQINEHHYDIGMAISSGIATILTPVGFVWTFYAFSQIGPLMIYQSLANIMSDPLFYDGIIAMLVFLSVDIYVLIKLLSKSEVSEVKGKYIEIVPVKKYEMEVTQRLPY